MEKLIPLLLTLSLVSMPVARAEEPEIVPGVITSPNVDITADDGSLLSDRPGVGDMIYIVTKPKTNKKGWIRITRSPGDAVGIGWVEAKNVQRFAEYHEVGPGEGQPGTEPPIVERSVAPQPAAQQAGYHRIAVLPFVSNDTAGRTLTEQFTAAIRAQGRFELVGGVAVAGVDLDSAAALRKVVLANRLDGVFVGKISGAVGGSRIFQLKFVGKDADTFVVEKTKRLPAKGDTRNAVRELADSCVDTISGR
jgi:hypothetical protein